MTKGAHTTHTIAVWTKYCIKKNGILLTQNTLYIYTLICSKTLLFGN